MLLILRFWNNFYLNFCHMTDFMDFSNYQKKKKVYFTKRAHRFHNTWLWIFYNIACVVISWQLTNFSCTILLFIFLCIYTEERNKYNSHFSFLPFLVSFLPFVHYIRERGRGRVERQREEKIQRTAAHP